MGLGAFWVAACVTVVHGSPGAPLPESVDTLVKGAIRANPAIVAARQKVAEMASHLAEMEGHRRLQLTASATASGSTGQVAEPVSSQSFLTVEGSLNAPIPNMARAGAEVAAAAAGLEAARAQYRRALLDIAYRTTAAAFELLRAEDAEHIAQENMDQATRQEADTKTRIGHGDVPPADLLKAEVPVAEARAALIRASGESRAARQNLNDLLQRDLNASIEVEPGVVSEAQAPAAADAVSVALAHSPDVLEAAANVRGAEANERIARRERDPDVALQLSHARTGDPTAYAYLTTFGVTISLPILDGGSAREAVKQAHLQTDQARVVLKLAEQRTRLDVEQALLEIETDRANADATARTADIAKQSLEKSRQSYDAGLITTRDVLDAQLILSQARIEANSARYDLAIALAHLRQLLGAEPK